MNLHIFLLLMIVVILEMSTKPSQAKTPFDSSSRLKVNERTVELANNEKTSAIQGPLTVVLLRHKRSHLNESEKRQKRCHRYCKIHSCKTYKRRTVHKRCAVCKLRVCGIQPPL